MKLYLDFEPCNDCKILMNEISDLTILLNEESRRDHSAKFLRHITYNHPEVVQAVMNDLPAQQKKLEFDFFK